MRISGGEYRGRTLYVPKGRDVRPTSDKIRQAIFNILAGEGLPDSATVLDGFCGTGALGLEALSRGATFCLFFDRSRESLDACRRNVETLGVRDKALIQLRDLTRPGVRPENIRPADLVFLDPPYRQGLVPAALTALLENGWLAEGALCVTETEKNAALPAPDAFEAIKTKTYGDTDVGFYRPRTGSQAKVVL